MFKTLTRRYQNTFSIVLVLPISQQILRQISIPLRLEADEQPKDDVLCCAMKQSEMRRLSWFPPSWNLSVLKWQNQYFHWWHPGKLLTCTFYLTKIVMLDIHNTWNFDCSLCHQGDCFHASKSLWARIAKNLPWLQADGLHVWHSLW